MVAHLHFLTGGTFLGLVLKFAIVFAVVVAVAFLAAIVDTWKEQRRAKSNPELGRGRGTDLLPGQKPRG